MAVAAGAVSTAFFALRPFGNKNTLVWLRALRTLVLDELLLASLSAPPAATEPMPQSAATAVVQPASGSNPARLERWFSAKEAQEWEWVKIERRRRRGWLIRSRRQSTSPI